MCGASSLILASRVRNPNDVPRRETKRPSHTGNSALSRDEKKWATIHGFLLGFQDESGVSERPSVHHTWAPKGCTPLLQSSGSWKTLTLSGCLITDPRGRRPRFLLRSLPGTMNSVEAIRFLKDLKRHLRGKKILLFWDGLPAHRSTIVRAHIDTQRSWLRVERFPGYAPELNPVEYFWACMKKKYLGNLRADFTALGKAIHSCKRKLREDTRLLRGFLRASTLY